jgi:Tfp pilus assembly protein PilN
MVQQQIKIGHFWLQVTSVVLIGIIGFFLIRLINQIDQNAGENKMQHDKMIENYRMEIDEVVKRFEKQQNEMKNEITVIKGVISEVHPDKASSFFKSNTRGSGQGIDYGVFLPLVDCFSFTHK